MKNDFIPSNKKENIFYGDIFMINNKGCLVMGHGKSDVCKKYTGENTDEIALDFACITEENDELYGHFEMEVRHKDVKEPIEDRKKLDYFIRMLSEDETIKRFKNYKREIVEISVEDFIDLCEFNITFTMQGFMPDSDYSKKIFFTELVGNKKIRCIVVPWCNTVEEKGKLIKDYIDNN